MTRKINKALLIVTTLLVGIFTIAATSFALAPKETAKYFNGPTVTNITSNSATLSISNNVLADITENEKKGIYFEYIETHMACIMIYPTPESCLPKKTKLGDTHVKIENLKANTSYTVKYKRDNTIMCITTPCPGNEFESLSLEFTTRSTSSGQIKITHLLFFGMRGSQVTALQNFLIERGYMEELATGFYGMKTLRAVQTFQKINNIRATGYVGPLTRAAILKATTPANGEYFEGKISAFSTQCFVDGICSVTIDGKVVVITRGWARDPVGTLQGVESIGDVGNKIGHNAKVYAAKTTDGYTLYGNTSFYLKVE